MDIYKKQIILYLVKIITLCNAIVLGWRVRKLTDNKYELSKDIFNEQEFELYLFMDRIVPELGL